VHASGHPYLGRDFVAMAHRGGWLSLEDRSRENTWYAFAQAVAEGYRYLETDVRTTADGLVVAFHDPELGGVTDSPGNIGSLTYAQLANVRVGGSDPIPLLSELLAEFPSTNFNIDLKDEASVTALPPLLAAAGVQDRVCIASFSSSRLRRFRRLAPDVLTATTPGEVLWYAGAVGLRRWLEFGSGRVLQVPARILGDRVDLVRPGVIAAAHAAGRAVHVWTVDTEPEMNRLIDLGVDGLVTNEIGLLKRVLSGRGLWKGNQ
jgi:glycerophosphoryl diester phosphodiesterase